jgi:hypothetical protein
MPLEDVSVSLSTVICIALPIFTVIVLMIFCSEMLLEASLDALDAGGNLIYVSFAAVTLLVYKGVGAVGDCVIAVGNWAICGPRKEWCCADCGLPKDQWAQWDEEKTNNQLAVQAYLESKAQEVAVEKPVEKMDCCRCERCRPSLAQTVVEKAQGNPAESDLRNLPYWRPPVGSRNADRTVCRKAILNEKPVEPPPTVGEGGIWYYLVNYRSVNLGPDSFGTVVIREGFMIIDQDWPMTPGGTHTNWSNPSRQGNDNEDLYALLRKIPSGIFLPLSIASISSQEKEAALAKNRWYMGGPRTLVGYIITRRKAHRRTYNNQWVPEKTTFTERSSSDATFPPWSTIEL